MYPQPATRPLHTPTHIQCQLPSLLQEAGCDLPECKRCMPDVWFDTVYKTKVKFTGAKLDNVTWVSATLGKQGFKGHEDPPVSTKDLYNGHLGYVDTAVSVARNIHTDT